MWSPGFRGALVGGVGGGFSKTVSQGGFAFSERSTESVDRALELYDAARGHGGNPLPLLTGSSELLIDNISSSPPHATCAFIPGLPFKPLT